MVKKLVFANLAICLIGFQFGAGFRPTFTATCNPSGVCNACKNCKYCQHCSKDHGTCSVCTSETKH